MMIPQVIFVCMQEIGIGLAEQLKREYTRWMVGSTDSTASQALDWTTANQQKIDSVIEKNLISMNIGKKIIPWEQVRMLVLDIMF